MYFPCTIPGTSQLAPPLFNSLPQLLLSQRSQQPLPTGFQRVPHLARFRCYFCRNATIQAGLCGRHCEQSITRIMVDFDVLVVQVPRNDTMGHDRFRSRSSPQICQRKPKQALPPCRKHCAHTLQRRHARNRSCNLWVAPSLRSAPLSMPFQCKEKFAPSLLKQGRHIAHVQPGTWSAIWRRCLRFTLRLLHD